MGREFFFPRPAWCVVHLPPLSPLRPSSSLPLYSIWFRVLDLFNHPTTTTHKAHFSLSFNWTHKALSSIFASRPGPVGQKSGRCEDDLPLHSHPFPWRLHIPRHTFFCLKPSCAHHQPHFFSYTNRWEPGASLGDWKIRQTPDRPRVRDVVSSLL